MSAKVLKLIRECGDEPVAVHFAREYEEKNGMEPELASSLAKARIDIWFHAYLSEVGLLLRERIARADRLLVELDLKLTADYENLALHNRREVLRCMREEAESAFTFPSPSSKSTCPAPRT